MTASNTHTPRHIIIVNIVKWVIDCSYYIQVAIMRLGYSLMLGLAEPSVRGKVR
jgi:hypothetical protein